MEQLIDTLPIIIGGMGMLIGLVLVISAIWSLLRHREQSHQKEP